MNNQRNQIYNYHKKYHKEGACSEAACQPAYNTFESCSINNSTQAEVIPQQIQPEKVSNNKSMGYAVQLPRLYDSVIFRQTAQCPLYIADESWTVDIVSGHLPKSDIDYAFKIEEICLGEYTLTMQGEDLSVDDKELLNDVYVYDGNLSSLRNFGIDDERRYCCPEGEGTTPLYKRSNLSYSVNDDPIQLRVKGSCGCAQFVATAEVSGLGFDFNDIASRVFVPGGVRANHLQVLRNLKLGFSYVEGATVKGSSVLGDKFDDSKHMCSCGCCNCCCNCNEKLEYTMTMPQMNMLLYLEETLNSISLENVSMNGSNDQIQPREVPVQAQICNFVGCSPIDK